MKTTALAAILAVSFGTAMAAGNYSGSDKDHSASQTQSTPAAATDHSNASGESFGEKTKRAFHAMGEKIRAAGHRIANAGKKGNDSDTHAMGAGSGAIKQDSERQKRMDDAYSNWNAKKKE